MRERVEVASDQPALAPGPAPVLHCVAAVLALQRTAGNRATTAVLSRMAFRPEWTSEPDFWAKRAKGGEVDTQAMQAQHREAVLQRLKADERFRTGRFDLLRELAAEILNDRNRAQQRQDQIASMGRPRRVAPPPDAHSQEPTPEGQRPRLPVRERKPLPEIRLPHLTRPAPKPVAPDPALGESERDDLALPAGAQFEFVDAPGVRAEADDLVVIPLRRNVSTAGWFVKTGAEYTDIGIENFPPFAADRPVTHLRDQKLVRVKQGAWVTTGPGTGLKLGFSMFAPAARQTGDAYTFTMAGRPDPLEVAVGDTELLEGRVFHLGDNRELFAEARHVENRGQTYDHFRARGTAQECRVPVGVLTQGRRGHTSVGPIGADDLFPPGREPSGADIAQLGLGDCWFQTVLIELAERDRPHLKKMMRPEGETVTVRFYHQAGPNAPWVADDITISASAATDAAGRALYQGGATWVRLMQKAFTVFAGRHGKYGDALQPRNEGAAYGQIEVGSSYRLFNVFYGESAKGGRTSIPYERGEADLGIPLEVANQLAAFVAPDAGTQTFLTASSSVHGLIVHALSEMEDLPGVDADDQAKLDEFRTLLDEANRALAQLPGTGQASQPQSIKVKQAAAALVDVLRGYVHHPRFKALWELCMDLKDMGSDFGKDPRFVYSDHGYAIVGVDLALQGAKPAPSRFTQADLAELDHDASRITLRNPHRQNEPEGAVSAEKGKFELTLAQFVRNYTFLDQGVVTDKR